MDDEQKNGCKHVTVYVKGGSAIKIILNCVSKISQSMLNPIVVLSTKHQLFLGSNLLRQ